ncbi:peptidylprolyl isomerase [Paracoccus benzoatiresistens]|uniref:Parvulin-like PPIase n=1 Tax=Paracoccus benzoatiresistens TaxID=2997341 RepID=A0ABT4JB58_9RHOB|nr:peptidylprolyl isomerase [Paracoccus sp. EF6]MCZ0964372.1 peptidylprolyl isomerase [Paracoccus sp. EF6]
MPPRQPQDHALGLSLRLVREPLVHFFIIAAALFGLFAILDDTPAPMEETRLVVTDEDARRLAAEFAATWQRPPTVAELDYMIGQRVREEVYVREALALGLDRDDAVIRNRLRMKMEFLTESGVEAIASDATLEAHLASHPERFSQPPLVAFEQVLLDDALGAGEVMQVAARLNAGEGAGGAARAALLPPAFGPSPEHVVDGTFGKGFFDALVALPERRWSGPVKTPFGRHLVRVTDRRAARLPTLGEIRREVESDWRGTVRAALREARFEALLSRYEIVRPDLAAVLAP